MIIGHQKQWQFLKKVVELGKVPHAYLFSGQDSIGKKTLALEFIKLLNCENLDGRPCRVCRSCQDIEKKTHPDLVIIKPQESDSIRSSRKEIKISQIRELHSRLSLRSYSAPFKSVIIDRAHCLNKDAQGSFLKLLEEPRGKTIFILITEYPEMLLPTILSRVERLRFYSAPAKFQPNDYQKKIIAEILQASKENLAERFQYAKKLAKEPQNLGEVLNVWLRYFREVLLLAVHNQSGDYSLTKTRRVLEIIQDTNFLISTTNVNSRLALEILMLEL